MIDSLSVYNDLKSLIVKDGRTGFFGIANFNALCIEVETLLLTYYCDVLEDKAERLERLRPFIKEYPLSIDPKGYVAFPSNYRRHIDAGYQSVTNTEDCKTIIGEEFALDYAASDEWKSTINSPIRKSNAAKKVGYYRIVNDKFQVSFNSGIFNLVYVEHPINANIQFTYDTVNQEETVTTHTNFMWLGQDRPNLIDLFLMHLGIAHRESVLMQWAQTKKIQQ